MMIKQFLNKFLLVTFHKASAASHTAIFCYILQAKLSVS